MKGLSGPARMLLVTETYLPEVGGGERQAAFLSQAMQRRGHDVTVLTRRSRHGLEREQMVGNVRVVRVGPAGPGRRRKWGLLYSVLPAMLRLRGTYDVVLVSGFRILAVPALLAARLQGLPVVLKADSSGEMSGEYFDAGLAALGLTTSSWPFRAVLALRNRLLKRAEAFVAMGEALSHELRAAGVPSHRVHVIPNGVDTAVFHPAPHPARAGLRARLGLPAGKIVIYTGRLVSYKGLPRLLEAWRDLATGVEPATLVLVGEGGSDLHACEPELREFVSQHRLQDRVRFAGAVDNVADWLRAADIFVFPTENEAFGLALIEAMACGLPCVTTDVGSLADFVQDGANALVVQPGDVDGLAAALQRVLGDAGLAMRLGAAARETTVARFGEGPVVTAYETLLSSLAHSRLPQRGS